MGVAVTWEQFGCSRPDCRAGSGHPSGEQDTQSRGRVRVGARDSSLTGTAGMVAVTELLDRLDVIRLLDAAVGPIKQRDRGFGAG
jgi:hypothetical protein